MIHFAVALLTAAPALAQYPPPAGSLRTDDAGFAPPAQAARRLGSAAFRPPNGPGEVALAPDGATFFEVNWDPYRWLAARDARTGRVLWRNAEFHPRQQLSCPHAAGGRLRLLERTNGVYRLVWLDAATGNVVGRSEPPTLPPPRHDTRTLSAGPSDRWLLVTDYRTTYDEHNLEETETFQTVVDRTGERRPLDLGACGVVFSADGSAVTAVRREAGKEVSRSWDLTTGKPLANAPKPYAPPRLPAPDPPGVVRALHFSPDGRLHALFGDRVLVFDPATGRELSRGVPLAATTLARFSADGTKIVALVPNKSVQPPWGNTVVRVCDASTGRALAETPAHPHRVTGFALSPDGAKLYTAFGTRSGGVGTVREWDARTARLAAEWADDTDDYPGGGAVVSPDGRTLAYNDADFLQSGLDMLTRLTVWDLAAKGKPRKFAAPGGYPAAFAFTPDGRRLVSLKDHQLHVWDVASGELRRVIKSPAKEILNKLAVTPDGRFAVTAGTDRLVRVFDLESGKVAKEFAGHEGWIEAVAVSPDGKWLASASPEAPVYLWPLK
jgi:WD40 repeat protein